MSFDESMRKALEAAAVTAVTTTTENDVANDSSTSTATKLARSAAFFETLALLCRHAPPSEVFRAATQSEEEDREGDSDEDEGGELPRPQRMLLAALASASSLLGGGSSGGGSGGGTASGSYESRVLQEFAKRSSVVGERLAEALARSLVDAGEEEEAAAAAKVDEEQERGGRRPQLQAFFFGFDLDEDDSKEGNRQETRPTLENTLSFPVFASASRDLLSGGTGKALWPASRALASALLSRHFELLSFLREGGTGNRRANGANAARVMELGAGVGLVGAALSVGEGWWRRRRRQVEEDGRAEDRDDDGEDDFGGDDDESSPSSFSLWLTDGDSEAVRNAQKTLEANGVRPNDPGASPRIRVSRLDWRESQGRRQGKTNDSVLVVGSDITYDPESAPSLARCLRSLLERAESSEGEVEEEGAVEEGSRALLAGVVRNDETAATFERAFSEAGLSFSRGPSPFFEKGKVEENRVRRSRREVRAWHAGDEGVELQWWSVRRVHGGGKM